METTHLKRINKALYVLRFVCYKIAVKKDCVQLYYYWNNVNDFSFMWLKDYHQNIEELTKLIVEEATQKYGNKKDK